MKGTVRYSSMSPLLYLRESTVVLTGETGWALEFVWTQWGGVKPFLCQELEHKFLSSSLHLIWYTD